jgi:NAD(P) transhydrogenase subunit beta
MLLAGVGTLLRHEVAGYQGILIAFFLGSAIGVPLACLMPMTAVPHWAALSHALGALAAAPIGTAEYYKHTPHGSVMVGLANGILLGFLTFTGSLMAFGKHQELLPGRPLAYRGQDPINLTILGLAALAGARLAIHPGQSWMFPIFMAVDRHVPRDEPLVHERAARRGRHPLRHAVRDGGR